MFFNEMAAAFVLLNACTPSRDKQYNEEYPNPFDYDDDRFLKEFRMTKDEVHDLCELLSDDLKCQGKRGCDLSVEHKVLISLKTLASGSFQSTSKDFICVSQPTVSKVLDSFINALIKHARHFIYMPRNTDEVDDVKRDFYKIADFPGIVGAVDGSHIPIVAPGKSEEYMYVNRKRFHSINMQGVCVYLDRKLMNE